MLLSKEIIKKSAGGNYIMELEENLNSKQATTIIDSFRKVPFLELVVIQKENDQLKQKEYENLPSYKIIDEGFHRIIGRIKDRKDKNGFTVDLLNLFSPNSLNNNQDYILYIFSTKGFGNEVTKDYKRRMKKYFSKLKSIVEENIY